MDYPARFPVYEDTPAHPQSAAANSHNMAPASLGQPSASPKRGMTYPGALAPAATHAVHVNPANYYTAAGLDPRSPKPPSVATIPPESQPTRPRTQSGHAREQSAQNSVHQPSPRHEQQSAQLIGDSGYAPTAGTGHSPSRQHLADPGRSPAVGHAVSVGSTGTPKHSPSTRLHSHRNGSSDTIPRTIPTKPSPSSTIHQQLPQYTNATAVQSHAASRPDNASLSRQPNASAGYPELARYRSPAPVGYPNAQPPPVSNGATTGHSQSYSTQTAYDYQYGRSTTTHPQMTASQYPQPASQAQARSAQATEYGHRAQDPPHSAPPTTTSTPTSGQRIPPRSAPSPAPTIRPARQPAVSSPSGKAPASLQSVPPQPVRNQTYPAPVPSQYVTQHPPAHSRTASDPQYAGRAVNAAYATGSLPSRHHMPPRTASSSTVQQQEVLLTPSSLAPSMLPQVTPTVPLGRTTSKTSTIGKDKDKDSKKKGFFGLSLFRSRSSPPKQREVEPPPSAAIRDKRTPNISHPSPHPPPNFQAPQVSVKPQAGAPAPQVAVATVSIPPPPPPPQPQRGPSSHKVPIAAPTPVSASGRRSPNGKMFTPFRLLSRRHRTVSAASVEAVDGTVINAMLTGGSSTRSSTAGRPSPPLRDPMTAAQEWRNKEENEQQGRGTVRRRRPGVTFDVTEEVPEDGRVPVQKSLRANIVAMQSASGPVPAYRQATA
ncbi:hypothetical protein C8Q79DRAFT_607604 [Trametes meyenii]|nr:hypothetical protein C8Q79DRAFT_607604 [Trametes meyenii]